MKLKKIFCCIAVFLLLLGCASREKPLTVREPKKLITRDDYEELKMKPCEDEPVEVDYKKEGIYRPSIDTKRR